jgi:hypothetical protein
MVKILASGAIAAMTALVFLAGGVSAQTHTSCESDGSTAACAAVDQHGNTAAVAVDEHGNTAAVVVDQHGNTAVSVVDKNGTQVTVTEDVHGNTTTEVNH